jgi:hypothetical protein
MALQPPPQAFQVEHPQAAVLDADQALALQRMQRLVDPLRDSPTR